MPISIEYIADGKANTCENAYVHICRNDENVLGFRLLSSGGSWANLPVSKMKYAGQEEKRFWDFGSGIYRTRGIDFYATVYVWMCDLNEDLFSTMTHNKYYLYFLKQGRNGDHFFLSSRVISFCLAERVETERGRQRKSYRRGFGHTGE